MFRLINVAARIMGRLLVSRSIISLSFRWHTAARIIHFSTVKTGLEQGDGNVTW